MGIGPILGRPGIPSKITASNGIMSAGGATVYLPGGGVINGTKTRDPGNTVDPYTIRVGKLMGKITSSGKYANSVWGSTAGALSATGTTFTVSAASAAEIVRQLGGSSGTLSLTGPAVASGTARTLSVTVSGVNTSTGVVTITNPSVAQVEQFRFGTAATGGNLQLTIQKPDGTFATTGNVAWNATDATFIASLNTALDTASGVAGAIVASAISGVDPDFGFVLTYAVGSYPTGATAAAVAVLPTGATSPVYTRTTTAVDGRFVAGSLVGGTDGSQTPITYIPDGFGIMIPLDGSDVSFPHLPIGGVLDMSNSPDWPSDTGLRTWIKNALSSSSAGKFVFVDAY